MYIKLDHPTDPRYLLVTELPARITFDDIADWRYGKLMITEPSQSCVLYWQPKGPGTDWIPKGGGE